MKSNPNADTPTRYIASVPDDRRPAIRKLHRLIRKTAPSLKPHIQHRMLGYGSANSAGKTGHNGNAFVIGLANQKNHLALYFCVTENGNYLAENYAEELGKVNCGKSCVRFRTIEDLNLEVVAELVTRAERLSQGSDSGQ